MFLPRASEHHCAQLSFDWLQWLSRCLRENTSHALILIQGNNYVIPLAMSRYARLYKVFLNFPHQNACLNALQGALLPEMEEIAFGDQGVIFQHFLRAWLGFNDSVEFPTAVCAVNISPCIVSSVTPDQQTHPKAHLQHGSPFGLTFSAYLPITLADAFFSQMLPSDPACSSHALPYPPGDFLTLKLLLSCTPERGMTTFCILPYVALGIWALEGRSFHGCLPCISFLNYNYNNIERKWLTVLGSKQHIDELNLRK